MDVKTAVEKIKELVRKGNVSKIVVRRKGEVLLSIPVNVGVVGAVIGLTAAKWAVLAAVLGTVGFGCSVEIVKDDGEVVNVVTEEDTQKAKDTAAGVIQDVKEAATRVVNQVKEGYEEAVQEEKAQDADFEQVVDDSEPKD
ncbi:MAG: DUF4342 domain-containing protein [Oscillospiraceae bacterium]|nr:DUF4342 domain-containing protein [Oscillospiraceae bacterium]